MSLECSLVCPGLFNNIYEQIALVIILSWSTATFWKLE